MSLHRSTTALLACCAGLAVSFQGDAQARSRPASSPRVQVPGAESPDATLSPYFFVKSDDAGLDQLPLKSTSAKVAIAGVIADVKVTQVYRNTGTKPLEALYVFPGSTRSAVYGMTMTIGERVLKAQIKERGQARADYEQAKAQGRSASLLEQHRPNVFQMNVANILPGDEIRVELRYTELLVPTDGTYSFVYPTVVGPRYAGKAGTESSTSWGTSLNCSGPAQGTPSTLPRNFTSVSSDIAPISTRFVPIRPPNIRPARSRSTPPSCSPAVAASAACRPSISSRACSRPTSGPVS